MLNLPNNLPRRYRYKMATDFRFGNWTYSFELIGARGGVHFHVSGPHNYDGGEHWSAGIEVHHRVPINSEDTPPSHDKCWLLKAPCWHDGSSLWAQEEFLPVFMRGDYALLFMMLADAADRKLPAPACEEI